MIVITIRHQKRKCTPAQTAPIRLTNLGTSIVKALEKNNKTFP